MVFFVADDVKRIDEITISSSCGITKKNKKKVLGKGKWRNERQFD